MKHALAFLALIVAGRCIAQCPFTVMLKSTGLCAGRDTLVVSSPGSSPSTIVWYNGTVADTTVNAATIAANQNGVTVAGGNGRGALPNKFNLPNAIYVDGNGFLYVSDITNDRVQKFPPGSTSATYGQTAAGSNGIGPAGNQLQPNSVFVDGAGYMYVADNANARILKFPPGSNSTTNGVVVAGGNGQGNAANQFLNPVSVYVDAKGYIYVIDAANYRLQQFPPGSTSATNATTIAGSHGYGPGPNQFNGAACVHVDSLGNIYVADAANNRIQKFLPGATNATTVAGGNGFGSASNQLSTPSSVWVDGAGFIYVADVNNERIQKFPPGSTSATNGKTVAGGNGPGSGPTQFSGPNSVCVDKDGSIYVSDAGNNRIQKFSQRTDSISVIDTIYTPSSGGTYTAVVTNGKGCTVTTNAIIIKPAVNPTISISVAKSNQNLCLGKVADTLHFTANPVNGGDNPVYQWQVNGTNQGTNSPYFTAGFGSNDKVTCTLTSNAGCAIPSTATSPSYTVPQSGPALVTLTNKGGICAGTDTLMVTCNSSIAAIAWYRGVVVDTTLTAPTNFSPGATSAAYVPTKPGTYTAIVTNNAGCKDSTEAIVVNPTLIPTAAITASPAAVCAGNSINFNAIAINAGAAPAYQWLFNRAPVGTNSPVYTTAGLAKGDSVTCVISGGQGCFGMDTSNTIFANVWPLPVVGSGTNVSILPGLGVTLNLPVSGTVSSYSWQPPTGLSNYTVAEPVASPDKTTAYTLTVLSDKGCKAMGTITVSVSYPIYIPGAFTPNGDGHNDVFYIGGGLAGDKLKSFIVYGRWGQTLFTVTNAVPGDPNYGWDGMRNGVPQLPGAYVYIAIIASADGTEKVYKGTVVLAR